MSEAWDKEDRTMALTLAAWPAVAVAVVAAVGPDAFLAMLTRQLPLRAFYEPSPGGMLLVYGPPVLLGIAAALSFRFQRVRPGVGSLYGFCLVAASLYVLPMSWRLRVFQAPVIASLSVLEYFVLLPALAFLGLMIPRIGQGLEPAPASPNPPGRWTGVAMGLALTALAVSLALPQVVHFDVPQGADTYGQISETNGFLHGRSIFQDPHFFEERVQLYPPGAVLVSGLVATVTGLPTLRVWQILPTIVPPLAIAALTLPFARRMEASSIAALGILALCWREVLFMDVSSRIYAFPVLFAAIPLLASRRPALWAGMLGVVLACFHFALVPVLAGAAVVWAIGRLAAGRLPGQAATIPWRSSHALALTGIATALTLGSILYGRVASFGSFGVDLFSEVGLAATSSWGFPSLLLGPLVVLAPWLVLSKGTSRFECALAAGACVFAVVAFYFAHSWSVYHRYFPELALIPAAALFALHLPRFVGRRGAVVALAFLLMSTAVLLVPRERDQLNLAADVTNRLQVRAGILEAIKGLDGDAVVLVHPDEILNRYIPPMTGRYIFCATIGVTKERQFEVVSKPAAVAARVQVRDGLALAFFADPSNETLAPMRDAYKLDAIVLLKSQGNATAVANRLGATVDYQDSTYSLLRLPPKQEATVSTEATPSSSTPAPS